MIVHCYRFKRGEGTPLKKVPVTGVGARVALYIHAFLFPPMIASMILLSNGTISQATRIEKSVQNPGSPQVTFPPDSVPSPSKGPIKPDLPSTSAHPAPFTNESPSPFANPVPLRQIEPDSEFTKKPTGPANTPAAAPPVSPDLHLSLLLVRVVLIVAILAIVVRSDRFFRKPRLRTSGLHGGWTPLHEAPTGEVHGSWTPLHEAAFSGQEYATQLLLAEGTDVNAVDCENKTALDLAIQKNHLGVIEILREYGAESRA